MKPTTLFTISGVIGAVVLIIGLILGWAIIPDLVEQEIIKTVRLDNGTDQYKRFEKLPIPFIFNVYMFNITNSEDVMTGAQTVVEEKGPYTYREDRHKTITEHVNGTITYRERQNFTFIEASDSNYDEKDIVVILNPALNAAAQLATNEVTLKVFNKYYKSVFGETQNHPFLKISVKDFLFGGYKICETENLLCLFILLKSKDNVKNMRFEPDGSIIFTFFNHKNITDDGQYFIEDGSGIIKNLGTIIEWQDNKYMQKMWVGNKSSCNTLRGTDSVLYPPFIHESDKLTVFNTDICRTVNLVYQQDTEYRDVAVVRFQVERDTLDAPNEEKDTMCYCLNVTQGINSENGCAKTGIMELNNCYGAPIVLSWPHFLWADDEYKNSVKGVNPSEEKHRTYLDIEPNTGTPLHGFRRVQFNMFLTPVNGIEYLKDVNTAILPILWVDETIEINDDLFQTLQESFFDKMKMVDGIRWGITGAGIGILVITIILFAIYYWKRKSSGEIV